MIDEGQTWRGHKTSPPNGLVSKANDTELESWASEIKQRAMRRIGEISRELEGARHGYEGDSQKSYEWTFEKGCTHAGRSHQTNRKPLRTSRVDS